MEMTKKFLKDLCREQNLYGTPSLNDILYLHYKGFRKIQNLDEYTGLKVAYLEGNGLTSMLGLENQKEMKCLYLQENSLDKIEGLSHMSSLSSLNLNQNAVETLENLQGLTKLNSLLVQKNQLKTLESLRGLLECPSISCFDMQDNYLEDVEVLDILEQMPNLKVVYLKGNPFVKKIKNYRKVVISRLKHLTYLDDRPVFPEERKLVEAWAAGGKDGEKKERERQKEERAERDRKNFEWFDKMVADARKKKAEADGENPGEDEKAPIDVNSDAESDSSSEYIKDEEKRPVEEKRSEDTLLHFGKQEIKSKVSQPKAKGSLIEIVDDDYDSDFDEAPPLEEVDIASLKLSSSNCSKNKMDDQMSETTKVQGLLIEELSDTNCDELD
jgi:hypothetical protein